MDFLLGSYKNGLLKKRPILLPLTICFQDFYVLLFMIPNETVLIKFLFNWESKQNNQHIFINTFKH